MKIRLVILISLCQTMFLMSFAQVGLLSSNNKGLNNSANMDTANLPKLVITRDVGEYKLVSNNDSIRLNFQNQEIDSLNRLKKDIYHKLSNIEDYSSSVKQISERLNLLKEIIKKNSEEKKNHKQEIANLEQQRVVLEEKGEKAKKENMALTQQLGQQLLKTTLYDSLNRTLIGEVINKRAEAINEKLSGLKKYNYNNARDLYKNQYSINSYWFLIDSTKEAFNKNNFLDSLSEIYSQIRSQTEANGLLGKLIEETVKALDHLKESSDGFVIASINDYQRLNKQWEKLAKDTAKIADGVRDALKNLENTNTAYLGILKRNIKDKVTKKENKTTDFGAFPQITTILGKKEIIPQLQLFGSFNTENANESYEANIGLSFAPTNTPDTANLYTIFIPAASKFLIHSNFTWNFLPVGTSNNDAAKKIGFRLYAAFASKNLVFDTIKTVKTVSSSILYAKAGVEFGVLPTRLSIYGNVNTATILDKVEEFRSGTGMDSKFFGYLDCGAKFYLNPAPSSNIAKDLFIYANVNFIINSGDVKRITRSNDLVIPSIQIGMVKNLGKF